MRADRAGRRIYTLAEAATLVGRHDRSILRAEADRRIPEARRNELGHRIYDEHDVRCLRELFSEGTQRTAFRPSWG